MEAVDVPGGVDGAAGGDQRLSGDLAAEHALGSGLRAFALEGGRVDLLQVEEFQKLVDGGLSLQQGQTFAVSTSEPIWWTRRVLVEPGAFGGEPATTTT
ncbi:hypothetical protein GCM10025331_60850 [Actinoplanes utahensis]|nr:hypothetical protein Aut01nite_76530 [Actinoplanes utahensis]